MVATNPASTSISLNLGGAYVQGRFAGGYLQGGGNANAWLRDVLDSSASTGSQVTMSLNRPVSTIAVGNNVQALPSCGNCAVGCQSFNNYPNTYAKPLQAVFRAVVTQEAA